jgi:PST family polysaccharide transporter
MTHTNSYHTILRASSIIGAASVINVLIGLVRIKIVAVLLGPVGVGLVGLYISLMQTAATVSALGIGTVGTRQIAEANGRSDTAAVQSARSALFWGTLILALLGGLVVFLAREPLAALVLGPRADSAVIGWLAVGVALSVAAGSQSAYLTGLRRIGDIGRLTVLSAVANTVLGTGALLIWGEAALLALVLIGPAVSFALGHLLISRSTPVREIAWPGRALIPQWRELVILGVPFMLTGLITTAGFLVIRAFIQRDLGAEALGHFQAAWAIGVTYLGVVLGAMGTDYYPRLAATMYDREAACRLVNEQTEVALLLCGPALLAMLALAPWVVWALYTAEFAPAVEILRWQLLGDILKVMSWPLAFILLASGAGKKFILLEVIGLAVYVLGVAIGLKLIGLLSTGLAFLAMYVVYLPTVWALGGRRIGFTWSRAVASQAFALGAAALLLAALGHRSERAAAAVGVPLAVAFGFHALGRLGAMADLQGPVGRVAAMARRLSSFRLRAAE